jgi:hypothetical protein
MLDRRSFIGAAACAAAGVGCRSITDSVKAPVFAQGPEAMKAVLLHLGRNMWCEWLPPSLQNTLVGTKHQPKTKLELKDEHWNACVKRMSERKLNTLVIDIGEGLVFPSHPELAVEGSWTPDRMRDEVRRLREMGIEAVPKLNFSATHDGWLKDYHRMLSTETYYRVQRDLIRDVAEIFEQPRYFHLGYDEEAPDWIGKRNYFVMRQGELWWHDMLYAVKCAEDSGCRAWIWSDYGWHHPEFMTRCPKSVLLSNWYYDESYGGFDITDYKAKSQKERLQNFYDLEKAGFDQVPCGTNWIGWRRKQLGIGADDVIGNLVKLGRKVIAPERLKGFLMAPWSACDTAENNDKNLRGIDLFADALAQKR